jgi:predicted heme/steroid binding protein
MKRSLAKASLALSVVVLIGALIGPTVRDHIWPDPNASDEACPFTRGKTAEEIAAAGPSPHGPRGGGDRRDGKRPDRAILGALSGDSASRALDAEGERLARSRVFSEADLEEHDGRDPARSLLVALSGYVYDVSSAADHYGVGAHYAALAGRGAARAIVLPSLRPEDISDDVADFSAAQRELLREWTAFFRRKYPIVGVTRVASAEERARLRAAREGAKRAERNARGGALRALLAHDPARRLFTATELRAHDGSDPELPLLLAVGGHVVDVSASSWLYGPTAPRAIYAGRAVTRALVLQSTEPDDVARGDDADDFTAEQIATRLQRVRFYVETFPKLGELEGAAVIRGGGGGGGGGTR